MVYNILLNDNYLVTLNSDKQTQLLKFILTNDKSPNKDIFVLNDCTHRIIILKYL